jgi:hypothetical protein
LRPNEILDTLFPHAAKRRKKAGPHTEDIEALSNVRDQIAVEIINMQRVLPARYMRPYRGKQGLSWLLVSTRKFVEYYHSEDMLVDIYNRVHNEVSKSSWSTDKITLVDSTYVETNPALDDTAAYFATVIYQIIVA